MPRVVPSERLSHELDFALGLGAIAGWSVHRSAGDVRRYAVELADGSAVLWTAGMVEAFTLGIRAGARTLAVLTDA